MARDAVSDTIDRTKSQKKLDKPNIDLWQHSVCKEKKQNFYVRVELS